MRRLRIVASGDVQGVGYRALLKRAARGMGIRGVARNLHDGTVECYCEGEEGGLEKFIHFIDRKRPEGTISGVHVEKLDVFREGTKGYGRGPGKFGLFEIDYGRKLTVAARESLERDELVILGGLDLNVKVDSLKGSVETGFDNLGKKMDAGFDNLGKKMDAGFDNLGKKMDNLGDKMDNLGDKMDGLGDKIDTLDETVGRKFGEMDGKYHTISGTLASIEKKLDSIDRNFGELVQVLREALTGKKGRRKLAGLAGKN